MYGKDASGSASRARSKSGSASSSFRRAQRLSPNEPRAQDVVGLELERPAPGRLHRVPPSLEEGRERLDVETLRGLSLQLLRGRERLPRRGAGLARRDHAECAAESTVISARPVHEGA